ncbi:hypothetical protein OHA25_57235 [Nonomuraea sp. NBC_00507]|uniref:hypothetical protein n=1 Tax=Nonomuraea sp. NBC_00507 TaxID=2976002 RepID=UPI002E17EC35
MSVTTTRLTCAAGLAAVVGGLLFILIQLIHPHEDVATVTTTAWTVTAILTMAMSVLLLVGLTGLYLRQVTETGVLGLVGFLLFGACFMLTIAVTFVEVFVLPPLADQAPQYVGDFLATFTGAAVTGAVGPLPVANLVSAVGYLLGGLLFGVALFRARILARWAALLLAVGAVATLLVPLLPHALDRLLAFPVGLALAGLGYSLWREQRGTSHESVQSDPRARLDAAGVE